MLLYNIIYNVYCKTGGLPFYLLVLFFDDFVLLFERIIIVYILFYQHSEDQWWISIIVSLVNDKYGMKCGKGD